MAQGKYQAWLTAEGLRALEGWSRAGLTDAQIAANMDITPDTLVVWKAKYPMLSGALQSGRGAKETEVENALLRRALGYDYTETTVEEAGGQAKVKTVIKHMHPDLASQVFWLEKRIGGEWRAKTEKGSPPVGDFELVISGEEGAYGGERNENARKLRQDEDETADETP